MTKLDKAIVSLENVVTASERHFHEDDVKGHSLIERATARLNNTDVMTLAVFAGATGSGKSSLVNALVGEEIARVAPTRPTTSVPLAISSRDVGASLDAFYIPQRHISQSVPQDLVLVDLPDIDSTEEKNRTEAARMIEQADVLVWVLDPQKYADAVVHEDYLRHMTEHVKVMLVVVNQIDKVLEGERWGLLNDVRSLLAREGLKLDVLPVSAHTGEGVDTLLKSLGAMAAKKKAGLERVTADMRTYAVSYCERIYSQDGKEPHGEKLPDFTPVARKIAKGAGANIVIDAASASYIRRGKKSTRWPLTRWIGSKTDPLARQHLTGLNKKENTVDGEGAVGLSSVRAPESARNTASAAVRRYVENASSGLPRTWRRDVLEESRGNTDSLLDACDLIIQKTDLGQEAHPLWWRLVNLMQWLSTVTAIAGFVWLLLIHFSEWLKIQLPDPPMYSIFPLPALMLIGGVLLCLLLSLASSALIKVGAKRLRSRITKEMTFSITRQAREGILQPLEASLQDYANLWGDLSALQKVRS